ncbi:hypothetical protein G0Q06_11595 [Puniceicoccales bacterium CK1056]|uniref:Outer membrane beta-barrel protein n=1 Tax=Oceanipulchritudo coccoides TaxID=2706888 RepID=A0A6B2M2C7_9BACT|nr:hypothetical protein [Oceanipulchritudo coccoides]NDV63098.1 hypothetical protein [Oceanipulchritudo coccoides]
MKKPLFRTDRPCRNVLGLIAIASLMTSQSLAVQLYTSETEEPEPLTSEIVVSYGDVSIDDDESALQLRDDTGLEDGETGGIERLYLQAGEDGDWRFYLDGRLLFDPDDFAIRLEINRDESIFIDLDFYSWKEYEFGSGVLYPPRNTFAVLSSEALEKEINKLKLTLRMHTSDTGRIQLSYTFFERKGSSLSTRFGDDFQYQATGIRSRNIIPALIDGSETVHTVDAKVSREDGIDRTGMRLHYQRRTVDRSRVTERAAQQASANRFSTQSEESTDDLFSVSGYNRTELSDTMMGSLGFSYTRLDGEITGSRIFGAAPEASYDIDFPALQLEDRGFLDLDSSRKLQQYLFNANLVYTPSETVRWITGLRLERLATELFSSYLDTYSTVDWQARAFQVEEAATTVESEKTAIDFSAFLEGRYTGFEHILLYSRVELASQDGDLDEAWNRQELTPDSGSPVNLLGRMTSFDRQMAFWEVGMNYYPKAGLRLSLEGYLKLRENGYGWAGITQPVADYTLYPGYIDEQSLETKDVNARIYFRPFSSLKSVTRIDVQQTTIESQDRVNAAIDSSERERLVFNQSLTWTPHTRFFLSASYSYVEDLTESGAAELEGTFSGIVVNLPNDYWQVDCNLYYVLSKLIDIQLGYQYTEMSNYMDISAKTVPVGSDLEQHHGSAQLVFHINDFTRARIGYNYYKRDEPSSGEFRNYTAHLVQGSLQLKF